jgi:hypothetical protein
MFIDCRWCGAAIAWTYEHHNSMSEMSCGHCAYLFAAIKSDGLLLNQVGERFGEAARGNRMLAEKNAEQLLLELRTEVEKDFQRQPTSNK